MAGTGGLGEALQQAHRLHEEGALQLREVGEELREELEDAPEALRSEGRLLWVGLAGLLGWRATLLHAQGRVCGADGRARSAASHTRSRRGVQSEESKTQTCKRKAAPAAGGRSRHSNDAFDIVRRKGSRTDRIC